MIKQLIIYGRTGCPFCEKAKELGHKMYESGSVQEVIYYDQFETNWTKEEVAKQFGIKEEDIKTVPQIGVYETTEDGSGKMRYIGGYDKLAISDLY